MMCIECGDSAAWSRGLCSTCYSSARRDGRLGEYPTTAFLAAPEDHIRWALGLYPQMLADIAVEYGLRVTAAGS